jgi:TRAP-type C4-dicarboxylate transport system substrate-binding protein
MFSKSLARSLTLVGALAAAFAFAGDASADPTTLKVGTLAPGDSPWGQVFKVWKKAVEERSGNNLQLQFFWNGTQGDESAMVGKMRTGQLDGAALTAIGLGQIYKQVLVLQLPGLYTDWGKLDNARNQMKGKFDQEFDAQGFKVLGWGDVGKGHVMTKGSINVVIAPALAAEQLQWASRLDNINTAVAGVGIGALVFSSNKIKSLPADAQNILIQTGGIAGQALTTRIRNEDDAAFNRLKARMTATTPTAAEEAQWKKLFADTRARLRGTVFNPQVFDDAVRYAQ